MLDKTRTTISAVGWTAISVRLADLLKSAEATDARKRKIALGGGCEWFCGRRMKRTTPATRSCSSAMAAAPGFAATLPSISRKTGLRAMAFNDPSALTCLGNDLGYENVFASRSSSWRRPAICWWRSELWPFTQYPQGRQSGASGHLQGRHLFRLYRRQRFAFGRRRQFFCAIERIWICGGGPFGQPR